MVVITIGGTPGAGKSSVLKILETKNFHILSTGEIFRQMAGERMMTLEEFGKYVDEHPEVDIDIDERQQMNVACIVADDVVKQSSGYAYPPCRVVLDGRMAGKLCAVADLRVWLTAPLSTRAERLANREGLSVDEAYEHTRLRELCELVRYKKYYDMDLNDLSTYDLVIDTSKLNPQEVADVILTAAKLK